MNSASRHSWIPLALSLVAAMAIAETASAQPFGPRIRPPRPPGSYVPGRPPMVVAPEEKLEVEGGIVVAFLNLDRSSTCTLVEAKLRDKKIVNWWRRSATSRLLDDLELSTAIDIPPAAGDNTPAKLPDALILCRTRVQDKDRVCEIVVCEPGLGLRLGTVRLVLTKEVGADVSKLADGTVKALGKLGEEMTELWGVPLLRSKDLGSKYESLRTDLAAVVEEELLRRKGALLVESDYAHAIALARKHAGIAEPLKRTSPIYLTGQFRNFGDGDKRTLAVTLQIAGSEAAKTDALPPTGVSPAEAEKALRERVRAIAKNVGGSQDISNKETAEEVSTLANLAKEFQKSGDAAAQLAILETSLLLNPNDPQAAQGTLKLLAAQTEANLDQTVVIVSWVHVPETTPQGTFTKSIPNEQMESQIQKRLLAMNFYRRGLFRIRDSFLGAEAVVGQPIVYSPTQFMFAFQGSIYQSETPRSFIAANQRLLSEQREVSLLMVRRDAKAGRVGPLYSWSWTTPQEMMQLVLRLLVELQDEPGGEQRAIHCVINGIGQHNLKGPEGEQFLRQLAEISNPDVQAALVKIKDQVAKYDVPPATPPMPPTPEPEEKDADVRFVPLDLGWKDIPPQLPDLKSFCELVVPAGKDADLFCAGGKVLLMKKKGETKLIFDAKDQYYSFKQFGSFGVSPAVACFDGKYVWLPLKAHAKPLRLIVIDVETEKVTELNADSGLPTEVPTKGYNPEFSAVPLGPGKAFLVGSFGKTWLGIATFDGEKGAIKVIHEAQDVPVSSQGNPSEQWRSTSLRFSPPYVANLTNHAGDKEKSATRILIGRTCEDLEALWHPLLVDPDSGKVTVMEAKLNPGSAAVFSQHDGSLYWLQTSNSNQMFGAEFMKLGFPDFEPTSLGKQPLPGKGYQFAFGMEDKRLHVFHDQWLTAEGPDQPLQALKGNLPTNERTSPRFLMRSNHYGWVVLVSNFNKAYAVEFKK
ncbi:MAG: hypothetical protein ACKVP0_10925 [Pirellulaceae bacterium]